MEDIKDIICKKQSRCEKLTLKEKLFLLDEDIDDYCQDYGTFDYCVVETFKRMLDIIKDLVEKKEGK